MDKIKRLLFNKIPYEIRREDISYSSIEEVEEFIHDSFSESFVGQSNIAQVYIDNKYNPQTIIVKMFKGIKSEEEIVTVNWGNLKDEDGTPISIWVHYIETDILPKINIIKKTCTDLNCTQNDLAYILGVKEQSLRNMISKNKFTMQIVRSIDLLIQNNNLIKELKECNSFKKSLKIFIET